MAKVATLKVHLKKTNNENNNRKQKERLIFKLINYSIIDIYNEISV